MKSKYRLLCEDQNSYFFEGVFLLSIQICFCVSLLWNYQLDLEKGFLNKPDILVQFNIFFSTLLLHFSTIVTIENGYIIMEFIVFHSEEFESPVFMFIYSILAIGTAFLVQLTNMLMLMNESTTQGIIGHFVEFKILLEVQSLYLGSRSNFAVKNSVADGVWITRDNEKIWGKKIKDGE